MNGKVEEVKATFRAVGGFVIKTMAMPVEILYLWLVSLPLFAILLYLRHRLRVSRHTRQPFRLFAADFRPVHWAGHWAAALRTAVAQWLPRADVPAPAANEGEIFRGVHLQEARWPVGVLLASGVLLLWLGQAAYQQVPWPGRWGVLGAMGGGLLLFLYSGNLARRENEIRPAPRPLVAAATFLQITPYQVLLLPLALLFALLASLAAGMGAVAYHAGAAVMAWLTAIVLAVLVSTRPGERFWPQISRRDWLVTAVLFLGAFLLRGLWLEQFPNTLSGDEGSAGLIARAFRQGVIDNPFTFGWFSFPSFYFAVQSGGIWLLGETAAALRITSALGGALTVVAVYWLARVMFDRTTALVAAAYLAASHYHVHISRIGLNNIWDGLFAAAAIGWLWHGWQHNRRSSFIFAGIALALGQYFYVSIRLLPLLFLLWGGLAWLIRRRELRQRAASLLLGSWAAVVVFLPLGILFARQPDNFNAPMQRVTIFNGWLEQEMALRGETAVPIILNQMGHAALGFTHEPLRLLYDPGAPLLLSGAAALFLLGLIWALLNFDLRYALLLLPLLAAVITGGLSLDPPASQRYIMSIPLVAVLLAVPLGLAGQWLQRLWTEKRVGAGAVTAVLLLLMLVDVRYYFFEVYDHYVLGGWNTQTATEIAHYLRDQPIPDQDVYFFGLPRMGYYSLSTIPFLAPQMNPTEVIDPLAGVPTWTLNGPTRFIFLPEREGELFFVQQAFPNGLIRRHLLPDGRHVFTVYEVDIGR